MCRADAAGRRLNRFVPRPEESCPITMNDARDDEEPRKQEPDAATEATPDEDAGGEVPEDDSSRPVSQPTATDADATEPPDRAEREPTPPAGPPARRGGRLVLALTLLLALAAAGAAGYLGWRLYQLEQRVAAIPDERAAALEPYLRPDALQPLRSRVESLEAGRDDLVRQVDERVNRLQDSIESVRAMTERHQIGWRLAEIRYLLSIAARRLLIAHDTEGAEAALEAADASVAELQDVRLLPLRKAIVEDLGAVRAVQPTDIEGISLRLQSLLAQVDSLPRAPLREARSEPVDPSGEDWWQRLRRELRDFVVIQRRPAGPAPVEPRADEGLPPVDALTLALQDARRAALARNNDLFVDALERASETLQRHFDPQSGATIRFAEGLSDLRGRNVETRLPDLTDTLELAQQLARRIENTREAEPAAADVQPATDEEE